MQFEATWSKPPEQAGFGDIFRREVTLTAYGVAAERLPDLQLTGSEGVVVSDHGGGRETLLSTDGMIGKVTRSWDIRVADPGVAVIGPVAVEHWHPGYHRSIRVEAPAKRLEPASADAKSDADALLAEVAEDRRAGLATGAVLAALILLPFAAALGGLLWAALPTATDRKMKKGLKDADSTSEAWRVVEEWASCFDKSAKNETKGYRNLSAAVFSKTADRPERQAIIREMLAFSRCKRITKWLIKTRGWIDLVFGRRTSVEG